MKKKTYLTTLLALTMAAASLAGCKSSTTTETTAAATQAESKETQAAESQTESAGVEFPTKNLSGIISFGAGGGTDIVARLISPEIENYYGVSMIMENKTGASGAVATQYVLGQPADGYTMLFSSETCTTWQAMEVADIDVIEQIDPIMIYGASAGVLVTYPGSGYESFDDLIQAAKENPGQITVGSTGLGTNMDAYLTMMKLVNDVDFNIVSYDSEGDARTALLAKQIDFSICNNFTAYEYVKNGDFVPLVVFHDEQVAGYEDIPLAGDYDENYKQYLPWGSFFMGSVIAGTDKAIEESLIEANVAAYNSDAFQEYLSSNGVLAMGQTGDEAKAYVERSRAIVWYLMYDAGKTSVNPADYGVERAN